jgi:hypothetical protein
MAEREAPEISLSQAARRLGLSWAAAWRLVLERRLDARQQPNGRWLVREASLEAYLRDRGVHAADGHNRRATPMKGH